MIGCKWNCEIPFLSFLSYYLMSVSYTHLTLHGLIQLVQHVVACIIRHTVAQVFKTAKLFQDSTIYNNFRPYGISSTYKPSPWYSVWILAIQSLCRFDLTNVYPVSYTHLDVYKRQDDDNDDDFNERRKPFTVTELYLPPIYVKI